MEDRFSEILANIEESNEVLEAAWKHNSPRVSEKIGLLGKNIGDRSVRKQFEDSPDVSRTNVLKRLKYFWGGSYLTRIRSGEIIFADLAYFRSLFLPKSVHSISIEQSFFKVNDVWFQAQKAFFARDMTRFSSHLLVLTQEIFQLRRMLSVKKFEETHHESGLKSLFKRLFKKFSAE